MSLSFRLQTRVFGRATLFVVLAAPSVFAQESGGGAAPAPATPGSGLPPIYGAPNPGGSGATKDINSHLPSSSRPYSADKADSFDLNKESSGTISTTKGPEGSKGANSGEGEGEGAAPNDSGSISLSDGNQGSVKQSARAVPEFHMVKQGDTLWGISGNYFQNPWEWPRVWSLNPQVENPHWIYPGDQLRMAPKSESNGAQLPQSREDNSTGKIGLMGAKRSILSGTVFIRDQGYIGDPERDVWGEVVGGFEEKMLLSDGDTLYLQMKDGAELRIGQRLTVFKDVRSPDAPGDSRKPEGAIVKVLGTIRIDTWDKDSRVARGKLIESLDTIERGAKVGPVGRRFDVVPPKPAKEELEAHVLTAIYPNHYYAQHQILFIDRGKEDGLVPGNRLKALRRGDTWRHTLENTTSYNRSRVQMDSTEPNLVEPTPTSGDEENFPDEVVGEVMVLRVEDYSATCIVLETRRALEPGERLTTVKGY